MEKVVNLFKLLKKNYEVNKLKYLSPNGREDCPQMVYIAKAIGLKNALIKDFNKGKFY